VNNSEFFLINHPLKQCKKVWFTNNQQAVDGI
jgi:hypothetical protein